MHRISKWTLVDTHLLFCFLDGQKHDVAEFVHSKDDSDDDKDEGSAKDNPDKKASGKNLSYNNNNNKLSKYWIN